MYCQFAFQSLFLPSFFLNLNSIKMTSFFPSSSFLQEGPFQANKQASKTYIYARKKVVIKNPKGTPLGRFYCIVMSLWIGPAKHCICILICFYFLFCFAVMQIRDSSRYRFLFLVFLDNNICNNIMCQIFTRRLKIHILVSEQLQRLERKKKLQSSQGIFFKSQLCNNRKQNQ